MNPEKANIELHLLPVLLGEEASVNSLSNNELEVFNTIKLYCVENERSARRFLRKAGFTGSFDETILIRIDKDSTPTEIIQAIAQIEIYGKAGLLSEAGCPGIADPGSALIKAAHKKGITVIPYPGPSSILLTLMGSGMNGQNFRFNGYLPVDSVERVRALRKLEEEVEKTACTQLFIETPYRNNALLADILKTCKEHTQLCIGLNLTLPGGWVKTMSISHWKNNLPDLHKQPAVFAIG